MVAFYSTAMGNLFHGDCLQLLKEIPDKSVDVVITDPPYGINYHSGHYKGENPFQPIANDDQLFIPLDELWRIVKDTGCMFVFFSQKRPLVDKRQKNTLIWVKNNWTAGDLKGDFGNQYECIAFLPKDKFELHSKRWSNVWFFDRITAEELVHPTQKPVDLITRLIECSTEPGDMVLDCFFGSGTTGIAAELLKRKWIGMEIEKKYIDVCVKRLTPWKYQKRLTEFEGDHRRFE